MSRNSADVSRTDAGVVCGVSGVAYRFGSASSDSVGMPACAFGFMTCGLEGADVLRKCLQEELMYPGSVSKKSGCVKEYRGCVED